MLYFNVWCKTCDIDDYLNIVPDTSQINIDLTTLFHCEYYTNNNRVPRYHTTDNNIDTYYRL